MEIKVSEDSFVEAKVVARPGDIDMEATVDSYERVLCHYAYDETAIRNDLESRRVHDRLNAMAGLYSSKCESKVQEYRKGFAKWIKDLDYLQEQLGQSEDDVSSTQAMSERLIKCRDMAQALDDMVARFLSVVDTSFITGERVNI